MYKLMLGHTLRMLRTTAGVSPRTLAKTIDVSPSYLSQVELGKPPPPTYYRITKIADTIGIPVSLLIEWMKIHEYITRVALTQNSWH